MTITTDPTSLKNALDGRSSNEALPDNMRALGFGSILRAMPTTLRAKPVLGTGVNPFVAAAAQSIALPDDAKAHLITRAYARAGTGTAGELVVDAPGGLTAAAGHIVISPNGDLVVAAADAWTSIDVVYQPEKYDVVELTLPVVPGTGVCLLPQSNAAVKRGVVLLMEAESLAGTLVAKMHVIKEAAGAPATTLARLDLAKLNVQFAVADAVTSARVKLAVVSAIDVDALLEAAASTLG